MKIGSKKWEKRGYTFGAFAVMILFLISVTYLSGNHLYSMQYSLDGGAPSYSACESCSQLYSSKQFTYGSNWGTWYVNQNALFPIQLKVNDMFNENSIDDVYSKYRVTLRDKGTGSFIKDYSGNFENAGYMESATISYNYIVPKEMTVEAEVYLSRDGGLTWEESYYYQTMTRPTWTFKFQATSIADIDKDGIPDDDDWCPTQPETVNGYLDNDGCPDILPSGTTTTTTTSGGTTTTIIVPSDSNSLPSNEPGDDATADDDGSGDGNSTTTTTDDKKTVGNTSGDIWSMSCVQWAQGWTFFGLEEWLGLDFGAFMAPLCYFYKIFVVSVNLPVIIISNLVHTLTDVFCIGSYDGFWSNALPLIVFGVFLLLMLIPDNVISLLGAIAIAYVLGTTAPVAGALSLPFLAGLSSVAIPAGIASVGLFSTAWIGPLAIVLMFVGLALFQILIGEGTQSFTKTNILGDPKTKTSTMQTVNVNVSGSSGMDKARTVFADAVLILSVLMIAECKLGIPIYSALWKIIWLIPDLLVKIATMLGGGL
jgi:hypothetical protein